MSDEAQLPSVQMEVFGVNPSTALIAGVQLEVWGFHLPPLLNSRIRRTRAFMIPDNNQQYIFFKALQLYLDTGIGNLASPTPLIYLRWSDDGGHTWSNYVSASAGIAGAFKDRVMYRNLGRARNRVFEFYVDDPVAWSAIDAYADMEGGIS